MKIASFVRDGQVDCGIVSRTGYQVFDSHPRLGAIAPERRLFDILAMSAQERLALGAEMAGAEVVAADRVQLLAAVPNPPLYIYDHGNAPTVWLRQMGHELREWSGFPRVPLVRIRPATALCGDGAEVLIPPRAKAAGGAELGIVIGPEAYRVSRQEAAQHIAGLVVLNDMNISGLHQDFMGEGATGGGQFSGLTFAWKAADVSAGLGPWVTTAEELKAADAARLRPQALQRYEDRHLASWVYDRTISTRLGGEIADQAMTNAYLWGAEDLISYLSRFMRLETGTVIGLAAPGWDGVWFDLPDSPGATADIAMELSEAGAMHMRLRRMQPDEEHVSPFLRSRQALGLSRQHALESRRRSSLWVLRGNYAAWDTTEGLSQTKGIVPLLYPMRSLGTGQEPLVLPPHATTLRCAVQLAGVIGPEPVYRATPETALSRIASVVPLLAVRDRSLAEAMPQPNTYEGRWAYFLGGCGDGFFQLGPARPRGEVGNLNDQTMRLSAPEVGSMTWETEEYLRPLADLVVLLSRLTTLLPGDVLSLGTAGPEMEIPPSTRVETLEASCGWGVSFAVPVDDQRESASAA